MQSPSGQAGQHWGYVTGAWGAWKRDREGEACTEKTRQLPEGSKVGSSRS